MVDTASPFWLALTFSRYPAERNYFLQGWISFRHRGISRRRCPISYRRSGAYRFKRSPAYPKSPAISLPRPPIPQRTVRQAWSSPMKTRAAVAFSPKKPLGNRRGRPGGAEGRRGPGRDQGHRHLSHRRLYAGRARQRGACSRRSSATKGAGVVLEVGAGVTSVKPGDHVIPLYTPECRQCKSCLSRKTNLCTAIRATQGKGLMPDNTSRFSYKGQPIFHYMGCSTFSNHTVLPEIAVAKIPRRRAVRQGLLHRLRRDDRRRRCGQYGRRRTGRQLRGLRPWRHRSQRHPGPEDGRGGQDRRRRHHDAKAEWGTRFGMTHFVNPARISGDVVPHLVELTGGGADYTLRLHRQHHGDAPGAGSLSSRLGRKHHHRRRRGRQGNLDPAVSNWSPAGSGRVRLSAGRAAAPTCRRSSTGTWTARSRSIR